MTHEVSQAVARRHHEIVTEARKRLQRIPVNCCETQDELLQELTRTRDAIDWYDEVGTLGLVQIVQPKPHLIQEPSPFYTWAALKERYRRLWQAVNEHNRHSKK